MAIFDVGSPAYQTLTVGTTGAQILWSGTVANLVGSAYNSKTLGPVLRDITILNQGTSTAFIGPSTLASAGTASMLALAPAQQLTIQGWTATVGTTTTDIYAYANSTFGAPTTLAAGLATLASVV